MSDKFIEDLTCRGFAHRYVFIFILSKPKFGFGPDQRNKASRKKQGIGEKADCLCITDGGWRIGKQRKFVSILLLFMN